MNRYKRILDTFAYYLGNFGIFKIEILKEKIHELEIETNQFLFRYSAKHRRDYFRAMKGIRRKLFYWKERKWFEIQGELN